MPVGKLTHVLQTAARLADDENVGSVVQKPILDGVLGYCALDLAPKTSITSGLTRIPSAEKSGDRSSPRTRDGKRA